MQKPSFQCLSHQPDMTSHTVSFLLFCFLILGALHFLARYFHSAHDAMAFSAMQRRLWSLLSLHIFQLYTQSIQCRKINIFMLIETLFSLARPEYQEQSWCIVHCTVPVHLFFERASKTKFRCIRSYPLLHLWNIAYRLSKFSTITLYSSRIPLPAFSFASINQSTRQRSVTHQAHRSHWPYFLFPGRSICQHNQIRTGSIWNAVSHSLR